MEPRRHHRGWLWVALLLVGSLLLAACGSDDETLTEPTVTDATAAPATDPEPADPEPAPDPEPADTEPEPVVEEPVEIIELNILHSWGPDDAKGPTQKAIFEAFMEANPDIVIKEDIQTGEDIPTRLETTFLAGTEADVVMYNYLAASFDWLDDGITVPVTDFSTAWGFDERWASVPVEQYTRPSDGELAAFPYEGFTWPIWYNTSIFEEAGAEIPTTMAELITASALIRDAGFQPFAVGGNDWTGREMFHLLLASSMTVETASAVFAEGGFAENPDAVAAVEAFVELRDAGVFADSVEGLEFNSMNELFFSGQAAMMHGGSWSFSALPEEMLPVVQLGGLPSLEVTPFALPTARSAFSAKGVFITRNGADKIDAVERFVKFLYSPENYGLQVEAGGLTPAVNDIDVTALDLNPLFQESLGLADVVDFALSTELVLPAIYDEAEAAAVRDAWIPGTSAEDIIESLDDAYES